MIGESEPPAGANCHKLSIKYGGKPATGMSSEFRVISNVPDHQRL